MEGSHQLTIVFQLFFSMLSNSIDSVHFPQTILEFVRIAFGQKSQRKPAGYFAEQTQKEKKSFGHSRGIFIRPSSGYSFLFFGHNEPCIFRAESALFIRSQQGWLP